MQSSTAMSEQRKQRSTEHYGLGQSGYTAGRNEPDPSLAFDDRNTSYLEPTNDASDELGEDERFKARGSRRWVPDESEQKTPD
jgi:hypothetical protein